MKRMGILLALLLILCACVPVAPERETLTLDYEGVAVAVGASVEQLLGVWSVDYTRQESESCAGVGVDYLYTFPSMRLYTFAPEGGVERVSAVAYTDDGADTRGAHIGATVEEAVAAFGDPDEQSEARLVFRDGTAVLTVALRDGRITGITLSEP